MDEPKIRVGICDGYSEIRGRLNGVYRTNGSTLSGEFTARPCEGAVALYDALGREILRSPAIRLMAGSRETFTLREVTIGVRFHWERREEQTFPGDLVLRLSGQGSLVAINEVSVEEYLMSVVASEMSGEAPFEFLKAHAIASRSWLVAMLRRGGAAKGGGRETETRREGEVIRWYDREDHSLFDVCADDHCQRYQGITGKASGRAAEAVRVTRGVFLIYEGAICDARYHKSCGGLTEDYATCWEEVSVRYLSHVSDSARPYAPLRTERDAERWILSCPDVFCRTEDQGLLRRILPASDRETVDFSRWQVSYGREELEAILREKSGIDFGVLHDLVPLKRGPSGRIRLLRIAGSKATLAVGKELEIRRWLSPSHLYSSAFIVSATRDPSGLAARFTLLGAGWGHGVGLCQIGAAVMAEKGYRDEEILRHYFRGAALVKRY
ncbi:MAG: SpoIID/LytB domain-containing protein [Deltaproteobacteria bacterium]|nr:SpoIID/LytB domain-containing protein [Deltaproteobacteria bacterium]